MLQCRGMLFITMGWGFITTDIGKIFMFSSQTIYDNPDEFDGFRFAKLREKDEYERVTKYQMVNTAPDYVTFGHGRHAWYVAICHMSHSTDMFGPYSPGRFFAVAELKTMFCHLLMNYDVKFEDGRAVESWWTYFRIIDSNAMLSFRARSDSKNWHYIALRAVQKYYGNKYTLLLISKSSLFMASSALLVCFTLGDSYLMILNIEGNRHIMQERGATIRKLMRRMKSREAGHLQNEKVTRYIYKLLRSSPKTADIRSVLILQPSYQKVILRINDEGRPPDLHFHGWNGCIAIRSIKSLGDSGSNECCRRRTSSGESFDDVKREEVKGGS
jgi:hypothetical protein